MSAWNSDSGASVWAELVGRAFIKMGHRLTVFSFLRGDFHGKVIAKKDENYVIRCFTTSLFYKPFLNSAPILNTDFDVFIVNDIKTLPYKQLFKIFPSIKKRAKTISVIHENKRFADPLVYKFEFDAITCFDQRFYNFLIKDYPASKLFIIPYPCAPYKPGNKTVFRGKLHLPKKSKIVFTFGQSAKYVPELLPIIARLQMKYPILVLLISEDEDIISKFIEYSSQIPIEIRKLGFLNLNELYKYLYAADVLIYNKKSIPGVVLSSAIFQTLGAGCPILARRSNFVEPFNKEVMKYQNKKEFEEALLDIFRKGPHYQETKRAASLFVRQHSAEKIAQKYLNLFSSLGV